MMNGLLLKLLEIMLSPKHPSGVGQKVLNDRSSPAQADSWDQTASLKLRNHPAEDSQSRRLLKSCCHSKSDANYAQADENEGKYLTLNYS